VVGAAGFEPAAPCSQSRCSTRLSYAPDRYFSGLVAAFPRPENGQNGTIGQRGRCRPGTVPDNLALAIAKRGGAR
jgi:hypothetical protein